MLIPLNRNPLPVAVWLLAVCVLIYMVIAVGGYTRLTDSGLSIVAWEPISGVIPPLSQEEWRTEFENYQRYPEYQSVNQQMQLDQFKRIYWIEYIHRLMARLTALAFLLPFLYFLARRWFSPALTLRLSAVFILGGLQGLLGWYMVSSGLTDDPTVSQYRLTAHLSLAILLYGYVLWLAVGLLSMHRPIDDPQMPYFRKTAVVCLCCVALMQLSGGFMAGTHAGFVINTFPDMNGELIPSMLGSLQPWWRNLSENVVTIQFIHRWSATLVIIAAVALWAGRLRTHQPLLRRLADLVLMATGLQFAIGVMTLLSQVHLPIALTHQSAFVLLLTILIITLRVTWGPTVQRNHIG